MVATVLPRILYVAWQSPETRRFLPVGCLVACEGSEGEGFEFAYIQSAQEASAEGFRPFRNFPDLRRAYRSDDLFPIFAKHVGYFRLNPETADGIDLLSRSGGQRATDSRMVFPVPVFDIDADDYSTYFLCHGIRHLDPSARRIAGRSANRCELGTPPQGADEPGDRAAACTPRGAGQHRSTQG